MLSTEPSKPSPLSKLRRKKVPATTSTASLGSGSADGDGSSEDGGGLRASFDATLNKVKERARRGSVDDRRGSGDAGASSKRLSSFIPGRRKSSQRDGDRLGLEREQSGLSGLSGDSRNGSLPVSRNHSDSSLLSTSGRSSLLTDDEAGAEGRPVRPTLSPHNSHAGLLTLSSPELSAQTQPVTTIDRSITADAPSPGVRPLESTTSIPQIIETRHDDDETEPFPTIDLPIVRSPSSASTAEKLKGAFSLPRKQKAGGDTDSPKSASGGIGGLFRPKSRKNSISSQLSSHETAAKAEDAAAEEPAAVADPEVSVPAEPEAVRAALEQVKSEDQQRPETPQQNASGNKGRARINTESLPATPPNLVDTPTTFVTPPTPTLPDSEAGTFQSPQRRAVPTSNPAQASPPPAAAAKRALSSVESIRHRRAQSANLPSKLSNAIPAPLTPTLEESKTPGGTLTQPNNTAASGFFTSFFSAAQKAADQLSNNINTAGAAGKLGKSGKGQAQEVVKAGASESADDQKERAVDTLGQGELSLSHLGIGPTSEETSPMTSTSNLPAQQDGLGQQNGNTSQQQAEEDAAARAVSVAYEKPIKDVVSQATGRPVSVASNDRLTLQGGDQTPPRSGFGTDADTLKRNGSVRSKLSGRRTRRHRASSATTGTVNTTGGTSAIASMIQASSATLANPATGGPGHRLTGFAVASSKRNKDFHSLFRSVPEDDYLIEDYSAALQRDILLHGRLYVSEGHICFSSNILGWVTNLVISFDEVVSIEKKSTAVIFPNAIVISTLQARNTFASFVARDSTYELLIGIWKISHPNLKSSLNGVRLDNDGTGDKTEVVDPDEEGGDEDTGSGEDDDEVYDEDEDDDVGSFTDAGMGGSIAGSDIGGLEQPVLSRKASAQPLGNGAPIVNGVTATKSELAGAEQAVADTARSSDFPGPATHAPTECAETGEHYDKALTDTTIPAPLGKVYSLMFGPTSTAFMKKWLVEDQKSRELNLPDSATGLDNEHKTMTFDYIKPLNAPVGPKQTKCITTNTLLAFDLETAVSIDCSTQTPDVPSGSVFTTKTRYCLMWGPGNSTRLVASDTVEWTGKSWLKGPIESGAHAGQVEYVKSIVAALKAAVVSKPAAARPAGVAGKKGKRRPRREATDAEAAAVPVVAAAEQKPADWGLLEPLHMILEPLLAVFRPFVTSQTIIAVLFVLLVYSWMFPTHGSGRGVAFPGYTTPQRLAAYEELWRREESELWDWLEDRAGVDRAYAGRVEDTSRRRALDSKAMGKKLESEKMSAMQMDDAIRVTEERLAGLKEAVARKKGKTGQKEL